MVPFNVTLRDVETLQAEEEFVHPPHYPWEHRKSYFSTFDHAR